MGKRRKEASGSARAFLKLNVKVAFFSKSAAASDIRGFFDALNLDDAAVKELRNRTGGGKPD
jgi:hypothetical protein